jgi:hypothetical protein
MESGRAMRYIEAGRKRLNWANLISFFNRIFFEIGSRVKRKDRNFLCPKILSSCRMKLEFLDDIGRGGKFPQVVSDQLLRLFDFGAGEARMFKDAIQATIIDEQIELELSVLKFVDPINCYLTLQISDVDKGITTQDKINFVCSLTIQGYEAMIYLIEPFYERGAKGHQWLYELDCPIDFLFSSGGTW